MKVPDISIGRQLFCGLGRPELLGRGRAVVRGSAFIQGPEFVGDPSTVNKPIPTEFGTLTCTETTNVEMKPLPFYSLFVKTFARIKGFLKIDYLLCVKYIKSQVVLTSVLKAGVKNFEIDHPLDPERQNLVHSCLEGPEIGVYVRGRVTNNTEINLPNYWTKLINPLSISVQLQPIGAHQDIIVKRIGENKIFLQSKSGIPIDCFYHVYAERVDVPKLQVEVLKK